MEQEGVEGADQLASGNALICDMIGPRGDADSLELFSLKMTLCIVFSTNAYLVTWVRPLSENTLTIRMPNGSGRNLPPI